MKNLMGPLECHRQEACLITLYYLSPPNLFCFFMASLFTKAFYEVFMRWICETNPKDLRNFPSGVSGYVKECFLSMDGLVFFLKKKKVNFLTVLARIEPFVFWITHQTDLKH